MRYGIYGNKRGIGAWVGVSSRRQRTQPINTREEVFGFGVMLVLAIATAIAVVVHL